MLVDGVIATEAKNPGVSQRNVVVSVIMLSLLYQIDCMQAEFAAYVLSVLPASLQSFHLPIHDSW